MSDDRPSPGTGSDRAPLSHAIDPDRKPVLDDAPLFYNGRAPNPVRSGPLPKPVRLALDIPSLYDPDEALIAAANVALTLRLPLLLTGRPGTGKTELARNLAFRLHDGIAGRLFEVTVSSTSDKSDLLYRYDELARLRDAYGRGFARPGALPPSSVSYSSDAELEPAIQTPHSDRDYLELRGLGAAIVAAGRPTDALAPIVTGRALPPGLAKFADLLGPAPVSSPDAHPDIPTQGAHGSSRALDDGETAPSDAAPPGHSAADPREAFFLPPGARPPVVLIDEIDKAPREMPNDLLTELDRMRFSIPELGVHVQLRDEDRWPIVVITSNAERPLPDAFLRRCVCFEVEAPYGKRLTSILVAKLGVLELLDKEAHGPADIVSFVEALWKNSAIPENEKPGTARVLDFTVLLADSDRLGNQSLRTMPRPLLRAALTALLPSRGAQETALQVWDRWKTDSQIPRG
jgi:MoxR-like ATPase